MKAPQALVPQKKGFTLIELLVVIAIIAFLAVVLVVAARQALPSAKQKKTQALLNNLAQALTDYYSDFNTFPPGTAGLEWWRYLTLTGTGFQRPQKYDGTIRTEPYIKESDLDLPQTGSPRLPRDIYGNDIQYIYPVDNEVAKLTPQSDPSISVAAQLTLAQTYYHCVLLSLGPDKLGAGKPPSPAIVSPRITNSGVFNFTVAPDKDDVLKVVSGQ